MEGEMEIKGNKKVYFKIANSLNYFPLSLHFLRFLLFSFFLVWGVGEKSRSIIEWDESSLQELEMRMFKEMRQNFTENNLRSHTVISTLIFILLWNVLPNFLTTGSIKHIYGTNDKDQ